MGLDEVLCILVFGGRIRRNAWAKDVWLAWPVGFDQPVLVKHGELYAELDGVCREGNFVWQGVGLRGQDIVARDWKCEF